MILHVFAIALAQVQGGNASILTVDEAVKLAVDNAYQVRLARSDAKIARQNVLEARGRLGPNVGLSGSYQRYDRRVGGVDFGGGGGFPGSIDSKQYSASLSLPIDIAGVYKDRIRAAELFHLASIEDIATQSNDLKSDVRTAYFNVVRAKAQIAVQEEALSGAKERLDKALIRLKAEVIAEYDTLRFRTDVAQAEASLIEAQNQLRIAMSYLNSLLARPAETPFEVTDIPELPKVETPESAMIALAREARPEVIAVSQRILALSSIAKSERSGLSPSLNLSIAHNNVIDPTPFQQSSMLVGSATINVPLFDSGVTKARRTAAREEVGKAKIQLEQVQLGVSLEVRQALIRLDNALGQLRVTEANLRQQEEALRVATVRYEAGIGTPVDVTTAQEQLTRARTLVVSSRFEYLSAYADLQRAVGSDDITIAPNQISMEKTK